MDNHSKISSKDVTKIEMLYEKYKYMMFSIAFHILKDKELALDAVHQSFVKVMNQINKLDTSDENKSKNLLGIICRNIACDMYKVRKKVNDVDNLDDMDLSEDMDSSRPFDMIIIKETSNEIKSKIAKLPDIYRDVVELEYYHHYSLKEIAKLLEIPYDTIKKRSLRARKMLEKEIREEEYVDEAKNCKQGL